MAYTDEERRAILYRQQQARRKAAESARLQLLAGNPRAFYDLVLNWRPLIKVGTPINYQASDIPKKGDYSDE